MPGGKGKGNTGGGGQGKMSSTAKGGTSGLKSSKGGPAGAHQGGAPRGASRMDPSHREQRRKEDRHGHAKEQ